MAQKDKIKELVGRSLGSYHTKSLQQIDRIERKNKEQNHKISILTNELDNDYLTKTEEGSVISLEHSKEGMVYLDELQGNTLVNYCTDGAKELTLNGDIDIEGTSVTLTDTVDNGLVDVACEGDTLVNLAPSGVALCNDVSDFKHNYFDIKMTQNSDSITFTTNQEGFLIAGYDNRNNNMLKHNSKYIVMWDIEVVKISGEYMYVGCGSYESMIPKEQKKLSSGRGIVATTFSTNSKDITSGNYGWISIRSNISNEPIGSSFKAYGCVVLELSDEEYEKPIDELINKYYKKFEGMKSVAECEDNKIEIVSSKYKANYYKNSKVFKLNPNNIGLGTSTLMTDEFESYHRAIADEGKGVSLYGKLTKSKDFEVGQEYIISVMVRSQHDTNINIYDNANTGTTNNTVFVKANEWTVVSTRPSQLFTTDALILVHGLNNSYLDYKNIKIEKGSLVTNWMPSIEDDNYTSWNLLNKKEISLNEPLRGLPNGVKDRFIKQGGKWYVERNCGEIDLSTINEWRSWGDKGTEYYGFYQYVQSLSKVVNEKEVNVCCATRPCIPDIEDIRSALSVGVHAGRGDYYGYIAIGFKRSELTELTSDGVKEWLSKNPTKVVAQLETPTYEELSIDPTLITYLDTAHISNNSTIPCNMKITNSGYNAIIKPSTQYTVAFDTNTSGTVGINLGGSKVTTTNNVATVTTPSKLTDDSLILYGKGIKANKVRLLEGDKTNWIPSFFEGMKSSFEDKLQEDGIYKMEILSNNRNLSVVNNYSHTFDNGITNSQKGSVIEKDIRVEPNTTYYISCSSFTSGLYCFQAITSKEKINANNHVDAYHQRSRELNVLNTRITTNDNEKYITFTTGNWECTGNNNMFEIKDLMLEKAGSKNEYVPNEQNKIQFSSIEPLRGVGDVKDRFVLKDGKLTIERNCGVGILNGSENWDKHGLTDDDLRKNVFVGVYWSKAPVHDAGIGSLIANNVIPRHDTINPRSFYIISKSFILVIDNKELSTRSVEGLKEWLRHNPITYVYKKDEPTYEEIPHELQKIILEGYENGTLFFDTNIPPTSTITYAGETPIVKSVRLNKTEVLNNTTDINDNIVPYLMDMDYRVVCLQLEGGIENVSMARLFGGTYEMLQRDILSNRYSKEEYKYRLDAYLSANKITENEYEKLGGMLNE